MAQIATKKLREVTANIVLVIAIVVSMGLLTLWSMEGDSGALHTVRGVTQTVASPLQRVGSVIAMPFQAIGNAFTNASASQEDILALRQENEQLRALAIQSEEYRQENERLSQLLQMSSSYALQSTGAHVISQSPDSWNRTVTLDKGSSSGIEIGMPVMSGEGLIGQVESVTPGTCTVRLITDSSSGVAVTLQASRAEGILSGSVDGLLYLEYIPMTTPVALGEAVITSGLGGVYPKGLIVGVVTRMEGEEGDAYHTLVVQPMASSKINEEVLILTGDEAQAAQGAAVVDGKAVDGSDAATAPAEGEQPVEESYEESYDDGSYEDWE